ncbi:hypothetical protein FCM35_KLT07626 [Carex littledalei]|uniref:Uncharacterized protein n=1 Tax=Carex littledalei TaxID=544730 RepID=A0A833VL63_9POAL|nr:hypothetical protein FCM35_KLT07626 [Carex littledalei]
MGERFPHSTVVMERIEGIVQIKLGCCPVDRVAGEEGDWPSLRRGIGAPRERSEKEGDGGLRRRTARQNQSEKELGDTGSREWECGTHCRDGNGPSPRILLSPTCLLKINGPPA